MLSLHENFGLGRAPLSAELTARVRENSTRLVHHWRTWLCAPIPHYRPSDWLERNIVLDTEAAPKKQWSFEGREYLREQIDQIENPTCRMITACGGTGSGKTLRDYGIMLYEMIHNPFSGLYIMPAAHGPGGATAICTQLIDTLDASADPDNYGGARVPSSRPPFFDRLPTGAARKTDLTKSRIEFGGNDLDFVGASSANQVGNKRCRLVFLGEQDKTKERLGREAGTDYLAGERIKNMSNTKIIRGSTPSLEGYGIWKALMGSGDSSGSDCRRRCLPCPFCNPNANGLTRIPLMNANSEPDHPALIGENSCDSRQTVSLKGWFVLIKDAQYNTALPTKTPQGTALPFAELKWDKEAKRKDDTWEMDRVIRSTRFECPHCGGHIVDQHRLWLDKNGFWLPTRHGEPGHYGYQLASFYAPIVRDDYGQVNFDSTWGGMAQKFLNAIENGTIGGYINSDLAEVNAHQQHSGIEIVSSNNFALIDWIRLMCSDFQKNWPNLWFVITGWSTFKLLSPFPIANGKPHFADHLEKNPQLKEQCLKIVGPGDSSSAWLPLAEILRFDARTGNFPMLDFLIAQKITGEKLVSLWKDQCGMDTMSLGRFLYKEMGQRLPKGGDSEVIAAGHCELSGDDAWEELREHQINFKVGQPLRKFGIHPNRAVMIDSGYAEKNNPEVLRKCYETGVEVWLACPNCNAPGQPQKYGPCCWEWYDPMTKKFQPHRLHQFMRPVPKNSWVPYRGMPTERSSKDSSGIQTFKKWIPGDPFSGLREAEKKAIRVLEAASVHYFRKWMEKRGQQKAIREAITAGKSYRGHVWNVAADCQFFGSQCKTRADFDRQMNAKGIKEDGTIFELGTGGGGKKRYPDHLNDAAGHMQEAHAEVLGFFSYERAENNNQGTK